MNISKSISLHLTDFFAKNKIIEESKTIYYEYCFEFILDIIFFCLAILILGILLGIPEAGILCIISILPLRMLAGGAHAASKETCNLISYLIAILCLFGVKYYYQLPIIFRPSIDITAFIIMCINIGCMAPVEHPNKRFDQKAKAQLKKYCFLYLFILLGIYTLLFLHEMYNLCFLMNFTSFIVLINQYIGIVKYRKK